MKTVYLLFTALCCIGCASKESSPLENIRPENIEETIEYLNAQNLSLEEKEAIVEQLNADESKFPYYQAFDTAAYLQKQHLQSEFNLISDTLTQKLDTLTLRYMAYACFCPQWVPIDCIARNRPDVDGFYVEPAAVGIVLPEGFTAGTTVTFIGRIEDNRPLIHPKDSDSNDPIPGKEFYYYSYKTHKPYNLWGESVFHSYNIHIIEETIIGDYMARVITVH